MSTIREYASSTYQDYTTDTYKDSTSNKNKDSASNTYKEDKVNTHRDYSYLFSNTNSNADGNSFLSCLGVSGDGFSLADYASIKSGSYRKLLKAYYKKADADRSAGGDTRQNLTLMQSSANALSQSAQSLMNESLWKKKKTTVTDEKTGEKTTKSDYDWDTIIKNVKSFIEDYNDTVQRAGNSSTNGVLRNAVWMTDLTKANKNLLASAGITIGKGNKLELDEDAIKKADIGTLKLLFTGQNSYASKISQKANSISMAASGAGGTYTSSGTYASALSRVASTKIDKEV